MNGNHPEFIKCAMEAIEQGVRPYAIKEECVWRMELQSNHFNINNPTNKE